MAKPALSLAVAVVLALLCRGGSAEPAGRLDPPLPDRELVVGTKDAPPFAMKQQDGSWRGISIDLWSRIADHLHLRYRFVEVETVQGLLTGAADGTFDAAIAALTVTAARERQLDFTHPFYSTGLGVAVPMSESRGMAVFRALTSFGFLQAIAVLVGIAISVGFAVWLLERRKTDHFGGGARGLGTGLWWSASAMTQKGAAEHAPRTLFGRAVAIAWMIASVIAIAVFTAGITSTLTKRELQGIVHSASDLRSVRVGAPSGSASVDYLDRQRIVHRKFATPQAGLAALQAGTIDAFVYDRPLLTWLVLKDFSSTLRVLDLVLDSQSYAIALPKGSPLRQLLNEPLLEQIESDWWQQTLFQYLGKM